jgi:hypothetical protein
MALTGTFKNGLPATGEQMANAKIRIRVTGLEKSRVYTVTYPYGKEIYVSKADPDSTEGKGMIDETMVVGCGSNGACDFTRALGGGIGPFLVWDNFSADPAELTDPQTGRKYVGKPDVTHKIAGSPTGNNFFRVEGNDIGGSGIDMIESDLFLISGMIKDSRPPAISIKGANPARVEMGTEYADAGATALDPEDGDVSARIQTSGLPLSTAATGTFEVLYSVSDTSGNTATASRSVLVLADGTPPVLALAGPNPANVTEGDSYSDGGATAIDAKEGDLSGMIGVSGSVNTAVPGTYALAYSVCDSAGNCASAERTVIINPRSRGGGSLLLLYPGKSTATGWAEGTAPGGGESPIIIPDVGSGNIDVLGAEGYPTGSLIKGPDGKIFLVMGAHKHPIRNLEELKKFSGRRINHVGSETLGLYPTSDTPAIYASIWDDGTLVRDRESKKVFVISGGMKVHLRSLIDLKKYAGRKIIDTEPGNLAAYPEKGSGYAMIDRSVGQLVRGSDKKIWYIKNSVKIHVKSLSELKSYSGMKIRDVSDNELDAI